MQLNYASVLNMYSIFKIECAILQLRIRRSGLHFNDLVTYLDVCNFCDENTDTILHEVCVQVLS